MIFTKSPAITIACKIIIQRNTAHDTQVFGCIAIKSQEIADHRPEARADQIGALGKEAEAGTAGIFVSAISD